MVKTISLAAVALLMLCAVASAVIFIMESDDIGDGKMKMGIQRQMMKLNNANGKQFIRQRDELQDWKKRIFRLKEQEIVALFGSKVEEKPNTFAFPVFEQGAVAFSGLMHSDPKLNKNHVDFYEVSDFAAMKVYYGIDGVTPVGILVYFRVDDKFTKLTQWSDLKNRWAWDTEHFNRLKSWLDERHKVVVESHQQPPNKALHPTAYSSVRCALCASGGG